MTTSTEPTDKKPITFKSAIFNLVFGFVFLCGSFFVLGIMVGTAKASFQAGYNLAVSYYAPVEDISRR